MNFMRPMEIFGYGTRNSEGERILEFAEAMGYVVTSMIFCAQLFELFHSVACR